MKKLIRILLIILLVLLLLYLFLIAPRMFGRVDMTAFKDWHYAHRGYHDNETDTPENSLASFEAAIAAGHAIELDLQLSRDNVPMVFHDPDLERMCGVSGKIWDYTCEELRQMKLLGTDQTIPTFEEVLALVDGRVPLLVEYKLDKVDTAVCEQGQALLDQYDGEYCIQCFHPFALIWYRKNAPHIARGQLAENFWNKEQYAGKPLYLALTNLLLNVAARPDFVAYRYTDIDNLSFRLCDLMGAATFSYTLKDQAAYEGVKDKIDCIIFDSFPLKAKR